MSQNDPTVSKKRANSIDVARLADVSQATVSYVLSNRSDKVISPETRKRVLRAAESLGYLRNRLADGILRGKTNTIGVLMPDFSQSFNSHLLMGLETEFAEAGYQIVIAHNRNDPEMEREQVRMLLEHRVEGLIAVADEATVAHIGTWVEVALKSGIAVCILDDLVLNGVVDTVVSDDVLGATLAVQHLLAQGHRRIAYLGGSERTSTSRDRRAGYEAALRSAGIEPDPALLVVQNYRTSVDPDLSPILIGDHAATAVFSASDGLVGQAMMLLSSRGFSELSRQSYVGYGNLEFSRYLSLTTVEQHPREMAKRAAKLMLARLSGTNEPAITEKVTPSLIVRGAPHIS